jgi:hypothetical protein
MTLFDDLDTDGDLLCDECGMRFPRPRAPQQASAMLDHLEITGHATLLFVPKLEDLH